MKLFKKTEAYAIFADRSDMNKVWSLAYLLSSNDAVEEIKTEDKYVVIFVTRLERAAVGKELRRVFGKTHRIHIRNRFVVLCKL